MKKHKPIQKLKEAQIVHFWARVIVKEDSNACWEWTSHKNRGGYGVFNMGYGQFIAHRISYFLSTGADPGQMHVCHSCDNPICVNPSHLFLGTDKDNVADMYSKGRGIDGARNFRAKLTPDKVTEIRELYASGNYIQADLAERYSVDQGLISHIVRNKIWKRATAMIVSLFFISLSAFCQKKLTTAPNSTMPHYGSIFFYESSILTESKDGKTVIEQPDTVNRSMWLGLSENEMTKLFQLVKAGQAGIFDSNELSASGAKAVAVFADSITNVLSMQYSKWHPAPPLPPRIEVPKQDSTSAHKK